MTTTNLQAIRRIRKHHERELNTSAAIRHALAYLSDCEPDRPHSGECSAGCDSPICEQWARWALVIEVLRDASGKERK